VEGDVGCQHADRRVDRERGREHDAGGEPALQAARVRSGRDEVEVAERRVEGRHDPGLEPRDREVAERHGEERERRDDRERLRDGARPEGEIAPRPAFEAPDRERDRHHGLGGHGERGAERRQHLARERDRDPDEEPGRLRRAVRDERVHDPESADEGPDEALELPSYEYEEELREGDPGERPEREAGRWRRR
jgi:hypothetical protein